MKHFPVIVMSTNRPVEIMPREKKVFNTREPKQGNSMLPIYGVLSNVSL